MDASKTPSVPQPPVIPTNHWPFTDEGILAHFPKAWTPRPQQIEAMKRINSAFRNGKRVVALEMPVGSGKSLVCMAFANAARTIGGTHFATAAKILQRQYERDFPSPQMEVLMGRANYPCTHLEADPETDAAHGVCRRRNKGIIADCVDEAGASTDFANRSILQRAVALELPAGYHRCPYWKKLQEVHDHPIALFNFSSFLFQQRIGRFGRRNLLLIDECFVKGTRIETPNGKIPIENLKEGDPVFNAIGTGFIKSASRRLAKNLVKVEFDDGSNFTVTENHPIFTETGWVEAGKLGIGQVAFSQEDLRFLQKEFLSEEMEINSLSRNNRSAKRTYVGRSGMLLQILFQEASEPDAEQKIHRKDETHAHKNRASTPYPRRKRETAPKSAGFTFVGTGTLMDSGISSSDEDPKGERLPDLLQAGLGESFAQNWNRSRRSEPRSKESKAKRQEKDRPSSCARVARISRFESKGSATVYNLEVSGHPSYFAEGKLVHNCHTTESNLMNFVSIELTEWSLAIVGVRLHREISSKPEFAEWLRETDLLRKIDDALKGAGNSSEDVPEDLSQAETDALNELQMKLSNFMAYLDRTEWILETVAYRDRRGHEARKIVARPLYAKDFAEDLLFRHSDRVLAMSGTILDVRIWADGLGLDPSQVAFVSMASDFPAENRQIFLTYAGNCSRKTLEETKPKLIRAVRGIMQAHSGQRGLIHTQSHELANFLKREIGSPRFLFADEFGGDKDKMLRAHAARTDSVLVSPGMKEGVDLKDELGRFQIVLKMPWASLGDKVVKERMERDPKWYAYKTMLDLLQSFGRTTRAKTDWSFTYVLDSGFENLLARHGHMIPAWVREAFRRELPKEIRQEKDHEDHLRLV